MVRSVIAGSYGSPMYSFLRYLHTAFQQWLYQFTFPPAVWEVPFSPHHFQQLLFVDLLMLAFLTSLKWYLIAVLICIYLIIGDIEHFVTCLLVICMSSLEKCLFRSSVQFSTGLCFFFVVELYVLLIQFGDKALVLCIVCNNFLLFHKLFFFFFNGFLCCEEA